MKRVERPGLTAVTVVLAVLIFGYASARILSSNQGLRGTYMTAGGEPVHSRIDRRVTFDNDVLLRSVYTNHWNVASYGFPHRFPAYRVSWTGFITIPERSAAPAATEPGLWQSTFANADFEGQPVDVQIVGDASFAAQSLERKPVGGPYSIEWYGQLQITEGGTYTFWTGSDDGSWLYVDGRLVVDNAGPHPLRERSGTIDLSPGRHAFRVRFNDLGGSGLLSVYWNPPDESDRQSIPTEFLTHSAAGTTGHALAMDSSVPFRVEVGGVELLSGNGGDSLHHYSPSIEPGRHPIVFELSAPESSSDVHFRPGWFGADGRVTPLPDEALSVAESPSRRQLFLDLGALFLAAGFAVLVLLLPAWRRRTREYGLWLWSHRSVLALVGIVLLSAALRLYQYDVVPLFRETFDEFKTGWIGWTLLTEGVPAGWSLGLSGPDTYQETWLDLTFLIGKPKLHPPPLFPLLTGVASLLAGVDHMFDVSLPVIRLPAIACSVAVTILLYFLALRFYDRRVALVAALLHATIPNIVISGRLAKEENLLALLAVAAVLCVSIYLDTGRRSWLFLSILAAGLSPLTKETGLYVAPVVFLLLARKGKWREILETIPLYVGLYLTYFLYCWWYSGNALSVVGGIGAAAWEGFDSVVRLFGVGRIVDRIFGSGWMIWLSLTLMAPAVRKNWAMIGPILSYVLVMGLTLGALPDYGWYRIPLYPFLCIAGAVFVVDMVRRLDLFRVVIFTVLALMTSVRYAEVDVFGSPWAFRWMLFFALVPFAMHFVLRESETRTMALARGVAVLLVALFILANVRIVLDFLPAYLGG